VDYFEACKARYYSKGNKNEVIQELNSKLKLNVKHISDEFLCLFNELLFNEPNYYWNQQIFEQTYKELEDVFKLNQQLINFDECISYSKSGPFIDKKSVEKGTAIFYTQNLI